MARLALRALTLAPVLVAGVALAHPGHGTPHLVNEADTLAGWWMVAALCAAAAAAIAALLGKSRS